MEELLYMDYYNYNCTTHSIVRAKERAGLNRKKATKMIEVAKIRGIHSEECTWSVDRRFLESRTNDVTFAVAYNGYCFIYLRENQKCLTMYRLPKNFGQKKTQYKSNMKKNKNVFEYCEIEGEYLW